MVAHVSDATYCHSTHCGTVKVKISQRTYCVVSSQKVYCLGRSAVADGNRPQTNEWRPTL